MQKQELINKYTDRLNGVLNLGAIQIFSDLIDDLKKLDGPEKVTIPQLIAEKIEYCKETDGYSLFHAMDYCYNFKECADWLERNEEVFARAWLDGYEIQGRKYVVTDGNHLYFKNYQEDNGVCQEIQHKRRSPKGCGYSWLESSGGRVMEEVIMATLPNKELNRLIKIEIAVENLIENGILDEDLFNEYLREQEIDEVK